MTTVIYRYLHGTLCPLLFLPPVVPGARVQLFMGDLNAEPGDVLLRTLTGQEEAHEVVFLDNWLKLHPEPVLERDV